MRGEKLISDPDSEPIKHLGLGRLSGAGVGGWRVGRKRGSGVWRKKDISPVRDVHLGNLVRRCTLAAGPPLITIITSQVLE